MSDMIFDNDARLIVSHEIVQLLEVHKICREWESWDKTTFYTLRRRIKDVLSKKQYGQQMVVNTGRGAADRESIEELTEYLVEQGGIEEINPIKFSHGLNIHYYRTVRFPGITMSNQKELVEMLKKSGIKPTVDKYGRFKYDDDKRWERIIQYGDIYNGKFEWDNRKLERIVDLKTLKVKGRRLTPLQKRFTHLMDPRFFPDNHNPHTSNNYSYQPGLDLQESVFNLHPLFRAEVLGESSNNRFTEDVNKGYITEKYFEDKWVSEGNNKLAEFLSDYLKRLWVKERFTKSRRKIKLLDIGPSGGAITTLFALKALDEHGLLDQVEIYLLDVVPSVLDITKRGDFIVPQEMIEEYGLIHAGEHGERYIELMQSDRVHPVVYDGETFPDEIKDMDILLAGYVHHHLNLHQRRKLAAKTEQVAGYDAFIGIVDFYVDNFNQYMQWYKTHFEKHGTTPPVEYPGSTIKQTVKDYKHTDITRVDSNLENSFAFGGVVKW